MAQRAQSSSSVYAVPASGGEPRGSRWGKTVAVLGWSSPSLSGRWALTPLVGEGRGLEDAALPASIPLLAAWSRSRFARLKQNPWVCRTGRPELRLAAISWWLLSLSAATRPGERRMDRPRRRPYPHLPPSQRPGRAPLRLARALPV